MASFYSKAKEDILHASKHSELLVQGSVDRPLIGLGHQWQPSYNSECWKVAFAPDESSFAWIHDRRKVSIIPWNRSQHCPVYQNTQDSKGDILNDNSDTVTIEALSPVVSVAFGCGKDYKGSASQTSETEGCGQGNISGLKTENVTQGYWRRFNFRQGLILATGHQNGRILIWDAHTGQLCVKLLDHKYSVTDLAFAPDGSLRLASASMDKTLKLWDLEDDGNMFKTLTGKHQGVVLGCCWSPDASMLASVCQPKEAIIWNANDNYKVQCRLEGHQNTVVAAQFTPDSALLATASFDSRVILWDTHTGKVVRILFHLHPPPRPIFASGANGAWVHGVSFSRDGNYLATVADDGFVRFWNLLGGIDPEAIAVQEDEMLSCQFSPSGTSLAVSSAKGNVVFYGISQEVPSLLHLSRVATRQKFSADEVDLCEIPIRLKAYLKYECWV
ncbi:WD repeat and SOCS box-containing protein 1-like isoform X2 [Ischnura elegans]|nr:WD repeat and SOCS box-containing protein 1-like isoform X2 [Ischnura elegans]XP_046390735.1 WD repeat and SOCS box-containing protein 1-like isoform X2 [Ischnura elegans]XP_046390736.1 WD repeat and SOCS box-containing protein 1-like isoform X2 [Ischnura elegans]